MSPSFPFIAIYILLCHKVTNMLYIYVMTTLYPQGKAHVNPAF